MTLTQNEESELRAKAIARLEKKRDFRIHLCIYSLVNLLLVGIWAVSGGPFWPIFPILGWGIGLGAHAWDVYGRRPIGEDEIRREIERSASRR